MSPVVRGVTFPEPAQWITDIDALNVKGEALLGVAAGALDLYGLEADRYEREYVGHGSTTVVEPSKANQLTVTCLRLFIGRPGEEQFQLFKGAIGQAGFQTAQYAVKLSAPWPIRQGDRPIMTSAIDEARAQLWRDGLVVWEASLALALGAVQVEGFDRQNEIALGPLVPIDPKGGAASWRFEVHVLL